MTETPDPVVDDIPPDPVSDLRMASATDSTVSLIWTTPADNDLLWRYDLRQSLEVIDDGNWADAKQIGGEPTPGRIGSSSLMTILFLEPGTIYYYAIRSMDSAQNVSALSNVAQTRTEGRDPEPPAAVDDLSANVVDVDTIELRWTAPGDDGNVGTAAGYVIRYQLEPFDVDSFGEGALVPEVPAPMPSGTRQEIEVTGLKPSTTYYFGLRTADSSTNISELSNLAMATTPVR